LVVRNLTGNVRIGFLESLCTPDYQQDRLQIKDASAATCEWIWGNREYFSYRDSAESSILLILGKAGSGKSVLAKHVWKRLSKELADSPGGDYSALLYYCCDRRTRPGETASSTLRALIHQFILQRPSLFDTVVAESEIMQSHSFSEETSTWTFNSLWSIFRAIVINSQLWIIHCIIDSLDESEKESMGILLSRLVDLLDRGTNGVTVKLFLASRIEGHVVGPLEGHAASILLDSVATRRDIETCVSEGLGKLKKRLRLDREGEQSLRQLLVDRADGMFLWAELAITDLEKAYGLTAKSLANRVRSLPSGLNALYERMLTRINELCKDTDTVEIVRKIFTWVALTARPLTLAELRIALALELDIECLASVEPLENIAYDLLDLCGSFVEVIHGDYKAAQASGGRKNEDLTATVRLIHESAKEFLIDFHLRLDGPLSKFRVSSPAGHGEIAQICLAYLLCKEFEDGPAEVTIADSREPNADTVVTLAKFIKQMLVDYEFLDYAVLHWHTHAQKSSNSDEGQHVLTSACRLLHDSPKQFQSWNQISLFLRTSRIDYDSHFTSVHAVAFLGLHNVLNLLLDRGVEIDAKTTDNWTALHYAAYYGHLEVAALLLDRGLAIEARINNQSTALHVATEIGYVQMVILLLGRGANIESRGSNDMTALHYAARYGHLEIAILLLNRGAEIEAKSISDLTAHHYAAGNKHLEVVMLLLDRGAEIRTKDVSELTTLHYSAYNGHLEVVTALLDRGAEIEAKDVGNWTALHYAAQNRHLEVATILLDRGAKIEAKSDSSATALHYAARNRHLEVAILLLDRGAKIETSGANGLTVLHYAVWDGCLEMVTILLDRGAEVEVKSANDVTALHYAAANSQLGVAKLLLDRGAEIQGKDVDDWTALHYAAYNGHLEVITTLLDRGAEIEAKDTDGWTALHHAASNEYLEIVTFLLDRGSVIEARTNDGFNDGFTALHLAARIGHLQGVMLLLGRRAEINERGAGGLTALHYAAASKHLEMLTLLLDRGAEIESKDVAGWTALQYAAYNGHLEVATILLDRRADIEEINARNRTALHHAANKGHSGMVAFLLGVGAEIEAKDAYNSTAFHIAVEKGHVEVVELLVGAGTNSVIRRREYIDALQRAADSGSEALVQLLIEKGTDINAQGDASGDALQLGCIKGHSSCRLPVTCWGKSK
jgi:ankyrin repeat protein